MSSIVADRRSLFPLRHPTVHPSSEERRLSLVVAFNLCPFWNWVVRSYFRSTPADTVTVKAKKKRRVGNCDDSSAGASSTGGAHSKRQKTSTSGKRIMPASRKPPPTPKNGNQLGGGMRQGKPPVPTPVTAGGPPAVNDGDFPPTAKDRNSDVDDDRKKRQPRTATQQQMTSEKKVPKVMISSCPAAPQPQVTLVDSIRRRLMCYWLLRAELAVLFKRTTWAYRQRVAQL